MSYQVPTFPLVNRVGMTTPVANVDVRYGPWLSTNDALTGFNSALRSKGLTVGVLDQAGIISEYWYKNGITDTDLVLKDTSSTLIQSASSIWNSTTNTVSSLSSIWNSTTNTVSSLSSIWNSTTNTVSSLSSIWNEVTDFSVTYSANAVFNVPSNRIVRGRISWFGSLSQTLTAVLPRGRVGGNSDPLGAKQGDIVEIINFTPSTSSVRFQSYSVLAGNWSTTPNKIIYQASPNLYTQTLKFVFDNSNGWNLEKNSDKYKHNGLDPITPTSILALPLSGGNITGDLTIQQKLSSKETISDTLSSQTIKLSNVLFTGKTTTAASLTGDNLFIEVNVNNQKKYIRLFDIELPLLVYTVDFENSTKGLYDAANINLNGLLWLMNNVLIGTLTADYKEGLRSARLRGYANSEMRMIESKPTGIGTVSFKYRAYTGDTTQIQWLVQYSMDAGITWTTIGSFTATSTVQTFSQTVNQAGFGRIRIIANTNLADANRRANVDDIVITEFL